MYKILDIKAKILGALEDLKRLTYNKKKVEIGGNRIKKYHIGGKLKSPKESRNYCDTCKDGELFKDEHTFKTDSFGGKTEERICNVCLTRYKIPLVIPAFSIDTKKGMTITKTDIDNYDYGKLVTTEEDIAHLIIKIGEEFKMEVNKMNEALTMQKDLFMETGICPNHRWVNSQNFRTSEGYHSIKTCQVCHISSAIYKGETITGKLFNVLNKIINGGLALENQIKGTEDLFGNLTLSEEPIFDIKPLKKDPLFDIFTIEDDLNFDIQEEVPKIDVRF